MIGVRELLEETELGLRLLTPGAPEGRIRTAYVSELPDPRRYLTGGELLLTNGLWREHESDLAAYVERLCEARVAALGFGLTADGQSVPAELVTLCTDRRLPLIQVPVELSFAEVIETVVTRAARVMRRAVERGEMFLHQAARGGGPAGVLRVLAREREVDAWLMVGPFVLASAGHPPPSEDGERAWAAAKEARAYLPVTFTRSNNTTATVFEIRPTHGPLAILAYAAPLQGLGGDEREGIDQALPLLALELARRRAQREMEQAYALELFELLMSGEPQLGPLRARLEVLKLAHLPLRLAVGRIRSASRAADEAEMLGAVEELAELTFAALSLNGVAAIRGDELVMLVPDSMGPDVMEYAQHLHRAVHQELSADLAIGLGSGVRDVEGLRSSFVQARYAARAAVTQPEAPIADWKEITSHRALLELHPPEVLRDFARAVLTPVIAADLRRNSELIHTLQSFFASGRRFGACAETLHVHPNTLRHRLARIEALTGRSLDDVDHQVDLFLALDVLAVYGLDAGASGYSSAGRPISAAE